ncbi:MAG: hypothetical protein WA323_24490 [Candidatus Nitrosopolaris sp.]|jgi:hypothetical protein
MKPINIENLMGHSTGLSDSYYRPTENDLLEDYLKCVDALTITDEKTLKMRVEDLANKSYDNEYLVNAKLAEKEKQIELLISKQNQFEHLLQSLIDSGQLKSVKVENS